MVVMRIAALRVPQAAERVRLPPPHFNDETAGSGSKAQYRTVFGLRRAGI